MSIHPTNCYFFYNFGDNNKIVICQRHYVFAKCGIVEFMKQKKMLHKGSVAEYLKKGVSAALLYILYMLLPMEETWPKWH